MRSHLVLAAPRYLVITPPGNGLLEADEFFAMNGLKVTAKGLTVTGSGYAPSSPNPSLQPEP